jgi:hypothetical protein
MSFGPWMLFHIIKLAIWMEWEFDLDSKSISSNNKSRTSGSLHGMFQRITGQHYTQYPFSDIIEIKTYVLKGRKVDPKKPYQVRLKLRSGKELILSNEEFNETNWRWLTQQIAQLLNIEPPTLPKQ